ncbi:hypothetical protein RS030_233537 [Cryptosporidium xiaoi]|uniref:Dual specificity phosphatase n=1 Tax=Cryptosporidium xiaoi TaxID=659607 RepID=A0AAV9XWP7_9CRYT
MLTNERLDVIKKYRKICSEIIKDKLYLGGYYIANDIKILEEFGISHIINVSGDTCMNLFGDKIEYKTYFIQDNPQESIEGVLYDSIEWIEEKFNQNNGNNNNKILVHCQEGVSRSSSIIIGYLMWKEKRTFNDVSEYVRLCRSTSSPNIGFTYQLLLFQKALNISNGVKLEDIDKRKCNSETGNKNIGNSVLFLEREYIIVSTKLYFILNNVPACLINWKSDGCQHFFPDSGKIYLLRQTLLEKEYSNQREKIWIWIGRQVRKEMLRECIMGALRFCRQILFIEMGIKNSIELENLDIRVDLILGALRDEDNLNIENITNVNSSLMIIEYFMENNESGDFINILFPNSQSNDDNGNGYYYPNSCSGGMGLTLQRSFSSPSIKSMSKSVVNSEIDESEIVNNEVGGNDSKLDSLVTVESSFSSLPSSSSSLNSNYFDDVVYPLHDSSDNEFEKEKTDFGSNDKNNGKQRTEFEFKSHNLSINQYKTLNTDENDSVDITGTGHFVSENNDIILENKLTPNPKPVGINSGGINTSKVFIPKLNISENKLISLKFSNEDNQDNGKLNKLSSNTLINNNNILLYRYPDYFSEKSESLKYFDLDDLLPESVCPLVIASEGYNGKLPSPGVVSGVENEFTIYFWLGSNTNFFNQAKEIICNHETSDNDIRDLVLSYSDRSVQFSKNHEFGILDLVLLFINNMSFITLKNIKGIYFEFENQESDKFWDLFYQSY